MAFVEWKSENKEVRPILIYFQDLYVNWTSRPYYFSKGNVTTAKKVLEFCEEYEVDPLKYVFTCFTARKRTIGKDGFRFFSSKPYVKTFVNNATDPTWFGFGTQHEFTTYDRVRKEILPFITKDSIDRIDIISKLIDGQLKPLSFIYLIQSGFLKAEDYAEVLTGLSSILEKPCKKVKTLTERGVLPKSFINFQNFKTFKEWCSQ